MNISKILNTENAWIGISLIDITSTGITRGESLERNQQRNWESLAQALSLKTQIEIITYPEKIEDFDIASPAIFGSCYAESQTIWAFVYYSEANIYTEELLIKDCDQIPMILGLEETARFMLPLTHAVGSLKNLHFVSPIIQDFDK